jgi:hypothetical protein
MLHDIHGRICVKRGDRFYAVPKTLTRTDRMAARSASGIRSNPFDTVLRQAGRARVISNQR